MDLEGFALSLLYTSGVTTALLVGAAFLFRSSIAHWLSKDLEARKQVLQQQLEAAKARHQQDLEAYKVQLIAETEKIKAAQELKKTGALRVLERRFEAFDRVAAASAGATAVILAAALSNQRTAENYTKAHTRWNELASSFDRLSHFLPNSEHGVFKDFINRLYVALQAAETSKGPLTGTRSSELQKELLSAELKVDEFLFELHKRFEA